LPLPLVPVLSVFLVDAVLVIVPLKGPAQ